MISWVQRRWNAALARVRDEIREATPARWLWWIANAVALVIVAWITLEVIRRPWHDDSYTFWDAWHDGVLYPPAWQPVSLYVYSPAFAQAFWPLGELPWRYVHAGWAVLQAAALVWMLRPAGALIVLLFPYPNIDGTTAVFGSLNNGNPMILAAAAITLGLTRWPGAFAFLFLTKVSAGVGLLYFAVRRDWRSFLIGIGTTLAIAGVSFVIAPHLWFDWIRLLAGAATAAGAEGAMTKEIFMPIPLLWRALLGLGVVVFAGWRGIPWLVPLGCFLALPDIHLGGYAVLTAVPAVWLRTRRRQPRPGAAATTDADGAPRGTAPAAPAAPAGT
jgi:hypothetical protein